MGQILEKGLLLGFGLSVAIFFFSIFTPVISVFFSDSPETLDQHDIFAFSIEYGLSYSPQFTNEEIRVNLSFSLNFNLTVASVESNFKIILSSPIRTTHHFSTRAIILSNSSISGEIEVVRILLSPISAFIISGCRSVRTFITFTKSTTLIIPFVKLATK